MPSRFNLQSQFGAEYRRNTGSVVNILTRSGTNHLHGSAFGFFRNSALDARNYRNTLLRSGYVSSYPNCDSEARQYRARNLLLCCQKQIPRR
jgi:hypothetical protein